MTGKSGPWTYGGISALTDHDRATAIPLTAYNVVRVQRDVMNGSSTVGAIATGVTREHADDALTGGVDFTLRWDDKRNVWNGHWVATKAPGAGGVKTSGGGATNFSVSHKHWSLYTHFDHFGRDFRVNDGGFLRARVNRNEADVTGTLEQPDPWRIVRSMRVNGGGGNQWTVDGLPIGRWMNVNGSVQFLNYWELNGGTGQNGQVYDDLDTRGVNKAGGYNWSGYANVSAQPMNRLQTSVSARYERAKDSAQWIENRDAGDGTTAHVYGTLHRNVVDLTMRGTYAFTPDLTLQAYLQPFVAVGDYRDIRRLARPRSYEFAPVPVLANPDFNDKSVHGNVVLRWEYLRGSTLFVVSAPGSRVGLRRRRQPHRPGEVQLLAQPLER